jgi:hypothetical protein
MNRTGIPRHTPGYELADLDGECMVYSTAAAKALYLNDTASMIWKLCDGERTVDAIEQLLRGAYPDAAALHDDVAAALHMLVDNGVVELP